MSKKISNRTLAELVGAGVFIVIILAQHQAIAHPKKSSGCAGGKQESIIRLVSGDSSLKPVFYF